MVAKKHKILRVAHIYGSHISIGHRSPNMHIHIFIFNLYIHEIGVFHLQIRKLRNTSVRKCAQHHCVENQARNRAVIPNAILLNTTMRPPVTTCRTLARQLSCVTPIK